MYGAYVYFNTKFIFYEYQVCLGAVALHIIILVIVKATHDITTIIYEW